MILGKASPEDMNLHPMRYQWAYDLYNQAVRNTWFPHEIALKEDLEDWNKMTEDERHAVKFTMAFFNPAELIVNRSIALGVYPYLKSPEAICIWLSKCGKKPITAWLLNMCWKPFRLTAKKSSNVHLETPSMQAKEAFVMKYLKRMTEETLEYRNSRRQERFYPELGGD
jgi:ribonucleoside-diphosphate reductase beta chain